MVQASLNEVRHLNRELTSLVIKHGLPRGADAGLPGSPARRGLPLAGTQPWSPSGQHLVTQIEHVPGNVLVRGPGPLCRPLWCFGFASPCLC